MKTLDLVVDGARIHAVQEGAGEPLILCHGWGACVPFWKETIPALAARHRVIAFDWPGFGASDAVGPFTIERYADLLGKIMDALGLRAATIVGHSMGGAVATAFALAHPERVTRLVPVCAPIDGTKAFPWYVVLASLPILRLICFLFGKIRWIRRLSARLLFASVPMYDEVIDAAGRIPYAAIVSTVRSMRSTNLASRLSELRVPCHAIVTDCDRIVKPSQQAVYDAVRLPTTCIAGCGHCPPVERPQEFVRALTAVP